MTKTCHEVVNLAVCLLLSFVGLLFLIDYLFTRYRPDFLKHYGKIDRNRQFAYTVGISVLIFASIAAVFYHCLD